MRYPPGIVEEIKARLPVSQVVSRRVALKKAGREYRGLSPFKVEKTPSFFVNDQKGAWFDFASGENGDIFKFLMMTEGLTFVEAIERLAEEAGVVLPKPTERDHAYEDARVRLYTLLEAAAKFFEDRLKAPDGADARRYVSHKRGLKPETQRRFRLGYAPNSRSAIKEHLAKLGFSMDEMISSGMVIGGPDIEGPPYDRFRNRVMFPITDLKDRVIAFGGRALEAGVPAKYLNSPETPLFHKGANLFNAAKARAPAHDTGRIIAVEGYMDVVALTEAGFCESVAPLGTALTEDQVRLLWRFAPEPILAFDGDGAGQKAAHRAVDTVLPHLEPGKSLRFAFLPDGLDPDDLIRQRGAEAMEEVLGATKSLADVLWDREWGSGDWSTPERRAALDRQIHILLTRIGDEAVRAHYRTDMRDRLARAWGSRGGAKPAWTPPAGQQRRPPANGRAGFLNSQGGRRGPGRWTGGFPEAIPAASDSLKSSRMVAGGGAAPPAREILLMAALVNHPWLLEDHCEQIAGLVLTAKPLADLRTALLDLHAGDIALDRDGVRSHLAQLGLDRVVALIESATTHAADRFVRLDAERAEVDAGWQHAVEMHDRQTGLARDLEAAEHAWMTDGTEDALARLAEVQGLMARRVDIEGRGQS